jgi:hypothetical protein
MSCCRVVIPQPHPWSRRFRQVCPAASFELPSDFISRAIPWSRSYRRVFPAASDELPSELASLAPSTETQSLSVAVNKSVPQLLFAFVRSQLALFLV